MIKFEWNGKLLFLFAAVAAHTSRAGAVDVEAEVFVVEGGVGARAYRRRQIGVADLLYLATLIANKVEMAHGAGKLILGAAVANAVAAYDSGIDEQGDGIVDGGTADVVAVALDCRVELVDVEVARKLKHLVEDGKALGSTPHLLG